MTGCFEKHGLTHIVIENKFIRCIILPQVGGKMIKLINKKTGTNFLLEPQNETKRYEPAPYGSPFDQFDTSGFDECFPTVEECEYPASNNKIIFPDHGELWCQQWSHEFDNNSVVISAEGVAYGYTFTKTIHLEANKLKIEYALFNISDDPFKFIWSAHPLLNVEPGDEIILPNDVKEVMLNWSSDESIGKFGDVVQWPIMDKKNDYSKVKPVDFGKAIKCFSPKVGSGKAALLKKRTGEQLIYNFDPETIPYIGIWLCYGGWPADRNPKHLTAAIEPATGRPDSLSTAIKNNECSLVQPHEEFKWDVKIEIGNRNL